MRFNRVHHQGVAGRDQIVEVSMDRRLFLTGLLGLAGATAVGSVIKPDSAQAAIVNPGNGILDELDEPGVTEINHRRGHRGRGRRHHGRRRPGRGRRRKVWRRVCGRVRIRGRLRRRCWDEPVWI